MRALLRRCVRGILALEAIALVLFGAFGFCHPAGEIAIWTQFGGFWLLMATVPERFVSVVVEPAPAPGCHDGFSFHQTLAVFAANTALLLVVVTSTVVGVRLVVIAARIVLRELAHLGAVVFGPVVRAAFRQGLLASQRELPP